MPVPYPQEFREDVVRVARTREDGVSLARIAKDFGIHEMALSKWTRQADIENGEKPGTLRAGTTENRELRKRIRMLKRENEVLRRAAAYLSRTTLPEKVLPARERARCRRDPPSQ